MSRSHCLAAASSVARLVARTVRRPRLKQKTKIPENIKSIPCGDLKTTILKTSPSWAESKKLQSCLLTPLTPISMLETSFSRQPGLLQMWFFFNPAAGTPQNTTFQHWSRGGRGFANDGPQKPKLAFEGGFFEMVLFKSPHGPDGDPENKHY